MAPEAAQLAPGRPADPMPDLRGPIRRLRWLRSASIRNGGGDQGATSGGAAALQPPKPAAWRRVPARPFLAAFLPAALLLALAILPLQGAAVAGYAIQRLWHRGEPGMVDPLLPVVVFSASLTLLALAWGPLAAGRGSGALAVEALQAMPPPPLAEAAVPWEPGGGGAADPAAGAPEPLHPLAGSDGLGWRVQLLARLPLLLLSQLAGLALGIETPAASFGATALLTLRHRLPLLQGVSLPLLAAIGAGAGLGAAFRSPLLGLVYALECLGGSGGLPLLLPTLLLAGAASLLSLAAAMPAQLPLAGLAGSLPQELGAAPPQPLADSAQLGLPLQLGLLPQWLPWAVLLTLLAALLGSGLRASLLWLSPRLGQLLQRRFLPTALVLAGLFTLLAHLSGGISLNDGALDLGPALAGRPLTPAWAVLPRLLSPLLAVGTGAPGGLPHDCMTLGALLVAPLVQRLAIDQQAVLIALGAAVVFSATCRTPLLAAMFVFVLQRNAASLPLLLLASACGAALSLAIGDPPGSPTAGSLLHALPAGRPSAAWPLPARPVSADRPSDGGG